MNNMQEFKGKTIILGTPNHFSLSKIIESELSFLGFNVINISFFDEQEFKYKNIFERMKSFAVKCSRGGKGTYKNELRFKRYEERITQTLTDIHHADFALMIRPDLYSKKVIQNLQSKVDKTIAYQWDGLNRYPTIRKYIPLFDRFFVFDPSDKSVKNTLPTTNFFTRSFPVTEDGGYKSQAYYVGSFVKSRNEVLEDVVTSLQDLGVDVKTHVSYRRSKEPIQMRGFQTTDSVMDYEENLKYAANTDILIDVAMDLHKGLSLRAFEAIGFGKKLITTNSDIKKYDFYREENILAWDGKDKAALREFVETPYVPIEPLIRQKYGFDNWIKYLLDEGDYHAIQLPD
jgi:hypothetical protein